MRCREGNAGESESIYDQIVHRQYLFFIVSDCVLYSFIEDIDCKKYIDIMCSGCTVSSNADRI